MNRMNVFAVGLLFVGLAPARASADRIVVNQTSTPSIQAVLVQPNYVVPPPDSEDPTPYWRVPWTDHMTWAPPCCYRTYEYSDSTAPSATLHSPAIEERADGDAIDRLYFSGQLDVQGPDGQWQSKPLGSMSFSVPLFGISGGSWVDTSAGGVYPVSAWSFLSVSGSGTFRACDYVDPTNHGSGTGRVCYPTQSFSASAQMWYVTYQGATVRDRGCTNGLTPAEHYGCIDAQDWDWLSQWDWFYP